MTLNMEKTPDTSSDPESSVYSDLEDSDTSGDSNSSNKQECAVPGDGNLQDLPEDQRNGESISKESSKDEKVELVDEYALDSSDEEDLRNTVGNIPLRWYDEYPHIGYDLDGKKILKPRTSDELDQFLKKMDDPNYWRTVRDNTTGQDVILTDNDLELIQQIQKSRYPDLSYDPYKPFEDFFTCEKMIHPVTNVPEHKRSFIPSKIEKEKVAKMVHAIKMGWIKPVPPRDDSQKFYMLWDKDDQTSKRIQHHIPAPKMKLPGHEESYNPPPEYLFTKEEEEKWRNQEPEERKLNFIPKKYSCLRMVPMYADLIKERFERCLDLYLCPRERKMRVKVKPEELIPKLPKPRDLQPFPTVESIVYLGHSGFVRSITVEPVGQFLASGSDDMTVRFWEVLTGRCMKTIHFNGKVRNVAWCPNTSICLIAVVVEENVYIINPGLGDKLVISNTDNVLETPLEDVEAQKQQITSWSAADGEKWKQGIRWVVTHPYGVHQVTWHCKGDYFATVMLEARNQSVVIHQLSKQHSQLPFRRLKGNVQKVLFHPLRPYFFVATQQYVRVYNLLKQEISKKLLTNCKWVSSIAIHPKGDNIIIGSYDKKLSWFDLDLSTKPYKTVRYHKKALRQVAFHSRYPLFASSSDDGTVIVSHGMVYNDLLQNPLIVPVKILRGHKVTHDLGVFDCCFHPYQPWIFSSGADATVRLFT
ncbi:ribosome biogenesis protein bop1 isoform X2 [Tachypleus tridentatus]|uniref:ribosome biogenesis protein bop1 isoform X2 n=1 Tax=Tachypleus tridentatus TaxID=6853 RepID=UPI003FCF910B